MLLLGVCPAGHTDVLFNPGINHLMSITDECYYISDTNEHYSDYQIIQASTFQSSLWRTSATLGLLAMYISGIDPDEMFHQSQEYEERDSDNKRAFPRSFSYDHLKRASSPEAVPKVQVEGETVDPALFEGTDVNVQPLEEEELLDEQMAVEVTNWQHDVQHGLQLLKYHGEGEQPEKKPCVKLTIRNSFDAHGHHSPRSQSLPTAGTPIPAEPYIHPPLGVIPEDDPEVVVMADCGGEDPHLLPHSQKSGERQHGGGGGGGGGGKHRIHSQPSLFHFGFSKRQSADLKHDDHFGKGKKLSLKHDNGNNDIDQVLGILVDNLNNLGAQKI